jgi:hypothetical protein
MKHISNKFKKLQILISAFVLALSSFSFMIIIPQASAANLTTSSIVELGGASGASPMIAATGQALAVELQSPTGGATTVTINMGSGTALASPTYATTYGSNTCALLFGGGVTAGLPGAPSPAGSGSTFTITGVTALTSTTKYCFFLTSTNSFTNPAAGVYSATITAGSDSQTLSYDVLSSGANAITVSGTVAPTFTMALGANTDALGTLSSAAVTNSAGVTTTITTNAQNGWFVYAEDSNAGLKSTLTSHTIATVPVNAAFNFGTSTGAEKYGLNVTGLTNTTAVAAYANGSNNGAGLATGTFYQIASNASAPNPSSTFTTKEIADIAPNTNPATDYSDVVTLVGSGSF